MSEKGELKSSVLGVRTIVVSGVLAAATILFAAVSAIPVPTPAGSATIMHIPAIVAGILEGPVAGALVGLVFGLVSFVFSSIPMFKDPLVAIIPRLFIGVAAAYVYRLLSRTTRRWLLGSSLVIVVLAGLYFAYDVGQAVLWLGIAIAVVVLALAIALVWMARRWQREGVALAASAMAGTLTNTVLVLAISVLRGYLPNIQTAALIGVAHGAPEIVIAIIVVMAVVSAWKRAQSGRGGARL